MILFQLLLTTPTCSYMQTYYHKTITYQLLYSFTVQLAYLEDYVCGRYYKITHKLFVIRMVLWIIGIINVFFYFYLLK